VAATRLNDHVAPELSGGRRDISLYRPVADHELRVEVAIDQGPGSADRLVGQPAHLPLGVLLLRLSPQADAGANSAALQVSDALANVLLVAAAEELCQGRLVMSHEGGYSPVYVPFCGLAVLEALSGRTTGVGDPFAHIWENSPQHSLTPWQNEILIAAGQLATGPG